MNYTFIITSTINTDTGLISNQDRYQQTLETIQSIRDKVPNAKILLVDSSTELSKEQFDELRTKVELFLTLYNHYPVHQLKGQKSPGETYIMMVALSAMKEMNMVGDRIFKISGRYKLSDTFDITEYENSELVGKYVFLDPIPTWMPGPWKLVTTRLFSFCGTLMTEMYHVLNEVMVTVSTTNFDIEHAYYKHIDKSKLVGFEKIHVEGFIASDGKYHRE
jgi:hypothetical protein